MSKNKNVDFDMVIEVPAGGVTAGPPIATSLGPKGIPLGLFAKAVNDQTASYVKGATVRVRVIIFKDKKYETEVLGYSTRWMILNELGLGKGSQRPGHDSVGKLSKTAVEKIATAQFPKQDLNAAMHTIAGTAQSMGISVE